MPHIHLGGGVILTEDAEKPGQVRYTITAHLAGKSHAYRAAVPSAASPEAALDYLDAAVARLVRIRDDERPPDLGRCLDRLERRARYQPVMSGSVPMVAVHADTLAGLVSIARAVAWLPQSGGPAELASAAAALAAAAAVLDAGRP